MIAPVPQAGSNVGNSAIAIVIGGYILAVMFQGNLGAFGAQLKTDFFGDNANNKSGFWQWAVATLVLVWIVNLPSIRPYSGALIGLVLVAMLIELETTQPGSFAKLTQSWGTLLGRGQQTITGATK